MPKTVTYKTSGVDINQANIFVKGIQGYIKKTLTPSVLKDRGAFGSLFAFDKNHYRDPVLVSSTDGVGTKLLIAQRLGKHDTVGVDLVAMNVNDILCAGAKPLFFLDYIACGKLDVKILKDVVKGIAEGCRQAGCGLIGGETAEMPGMYKKNEYDLAGFAVGVVDRDKIIDGSAIKAGDRVLGLSSNGLHSNGFSLVRKIFSQTEQKQLGKELLKPTRIYAKEILDLIGQFEIKGMAHMTGGAFYEKLTKILPAGRCFLVHKGSWSVPKIFQIIQKKGKITDSEMYRTFNMGIGLALVVAQEHVSAIKNFLHDRKIVSYEIAEVVEDFEYKIRFEDKR